MATATGLLEHLDEDGRFREGEGKVEIAFATRSGSRHPGALHFRDGLCIRAETDGGGDWVNPDQSPLDGLRFLFAEGVEEPVGFAIEQGRLVRLGPIRKDSTRQAFLRNFRLARDLFHHDRGGGMHPRETIWLTP